MEATAEHSADVNKAEFDLTLSLIKLEPERVSITLESLWEIESISAQLAKWAESLNAEDLWVRGAVMRMRGLSCICMSALGDGEERVEDLAQKLRG